MQISFKSGQSKVVEVSPVELNRAAEYEEIYDIVSSYREELQFDPSTRLITARKSSLGKIEHLPIQTPIQKTSKEQRRCTPHFKRNSNAHLVASDQFNLVLGELASALDPALASTELVDEVPEDIDDESTLVGSKSTPICEGELIVSCNNKAPAKRWCVFQDNVFSIYPSFKDRTLQDAVKINAQVKVQLTGSDEDRVAMFGNGMFCIFESASPQGTPIAMWYSSLVTSSDAQPQEPRPSSRRNSVASELPTPQTPSTFMGNLFKRRPSAPHMYY
ncbi:hypothetical protein HDU91_003081 [Kappamyces sp. JEL0680]|nr:hypothetical protein HDU91_003081 [Kappamyces sp. JEL0680]